MTLATGVGMVNALNMAPDVAVMSFPFSSSILNTLLGLVTSIKSRSQSITVEAPSLFGTTRTLGIPAQFGSTAKVLRLNAVDAVVASVVPMTKGAAELSIVSRGSLIVKRRSQAGWAATTGVAVGLPPSASCRKTICHSCLSNVIGNGE